MFVEYSTGKMTSHIAKDELHTFCGVEYFAYGENGQTHWAQSSVELPRVVESPTRPLCRRCQKQAATHEKSQDKLIQAAREARKQIAEGKSEPMDFDRL